MKKILTMALAFGAIASMSAQKANVDAAAKLSGKVDKIAEARDLIKQAEQDPSTANQARTYYTAGKIEFDAFDEGFKKRAINPSDASINLIDMGIELINGYKAFAKALPLDSVPNEKGKIKPQYSKDIISKLNGHHPDYFNYGGELFNNRHYPEAYEAFMIYGDMPLEAWADKNTKATADTTRALGYHYAGISAYSANQLQNAIEAFKKARLAGITDPQNHVYEIACWQNVALRDSTMEKTAIDAIYEVALDGYQKYGMTNPLFLINVINTKIQAGNEQEAIDLINKQLAETPDNPTLYSLLGYIYDRLDKTAESVAAYRKAVSYENADIDVLKSAARKIYNTGVETWDTMETKTPEKVQDVKVNYFEAAKAIAERAKALDPSNSDINYILDSIDYALGAYF